MKKMYIVPANEVIQIKAGKMMCISRQEEAAQQRSVEEKSQSWYNGGDGLGRETVDAPDAWDEW